MIPETKPTTGPQIATKKQKTTVAPDTPTLNPRQSRFVAEYLIDLNATQASIRAGYSKNCAKEIGAENLTKPNIAAAVQKAMDERANRLQIKQDRILQELGRVTFFNIRTLFDIDGKLKALHTLDDDAAAAITSVETIEQFAGAGAKRKLIGHVRKVRVVDKVASLTLAMRHMNMLTEKVVLGGDRDNKAASNIGLGVKDFEVLKVKLEKFVPGLA